MAARQQGMGHCSACPSCLQQPSGMQVMLWPEEMADTTLLVLSANDDLVPTTLVQKHLANTNSPCKVGCWARLGLLMHDTALLAVNPSPLCSGNDEAQSLPRRCCATPAQGTVASCWTRSLGARC